MFRKLVKHEFPTSTSFSPIHKKKKKKSKSKKDRKRSPSSSDDEDKKEKPTFKEYVKNIDEKKRMKLLG